ncbi:hypothetical protein BT67DRAFT_444213 [Trichocladium antarcticum]|uniref:Secreted protein n=1 Tax=Trichocladium antarcticum TaxID=1450529 RepID=A0AAN6UG58_9PEZI|nr:hypothetical protein BT67DRAFT_444213 [Trichocladium antarcticum]
MCARDKSTLVSGISRCVLIILGLVTAVADSPGPGQQARNPASGVCQPSGYARIGELARHAMNPDERRQHAEGYSVPILRGC